MQTTFLESHITQDSTTVGLKGDWVFENVTELSEALDGVSLNEGVHVSVRCE